MDGVRSVSRISWIASRKN